MSSTFRCLFEPSLLFNQTGPWLWCVRWFRVIAGPAKKRNGFVGIEFSDLFTPNTLKINCGQFPRLNPSLPKRDLFRSPISEGRRLFHPWYFSMLSLVTMLEPINPGKSTMMFLKLLV